MLRAIVAIVMFGFAMLLLVSGKQTPEESMHGITQEELVRRTQEMRCTRVTAVGANEHQLCCICSSAVLRGMSALDRDPEQTHCARHASAVVRTLGGAGSAGRLYLVKSAFTGANP